MDKVIITTTEELESIIQKCIQKALVSALIPSKEIKELLTLSEACEYLQKAKQTIYGYTSNLSIPFIKKGRKLYFKKVDLDEWLEEGKKCSQQQLLREGTSALKK